MPEDRSAAGAWPGAGTLLADRYELVRLLARGAVGVVWVAHDRVLQRDVAAKLLHPHLASDATVAERFHLEALAAAQLRHRNVAAVYDAGIEADRTFLLMELVDGPSLAELLPHAPLPASACAGLAVQVLEALDVAHTTGVVHRDIKPANVLVGPGGLVKVVDFGLAKTLAGRDLTVDGSVLGSPAYVAPEQVLGGAVDGRADLYSLGVTLWEAALGERGYQGDTSNAALFARLQRDLPHPHAIDPELPVALADAIAKATRRSPRDRFASATAMAAALLPIAGSRPELLTRQLRDWVVTRVD